MRRGFLRRSLLDGLAPALARSIGGTMYSILPLTSPSPFSRGEGLNNHGDVAGWTYREGANPDPIAAAIWFSDHDISRL